MAAKYHSAAIFITVTPNETGNAIVAYFSGDVSETNLDKISKNEIPPNAARLEIAGKDPMACDLFSSNFLTMIIDKMIGFDMETKLSKESEAFLEFKHSLEVLKAKVKELHVIVFLAEFSRDSDKMVEMVA